eukprot:PRCOL_00000104-RA
MAPRPQAPVRFAAAVSTGLTPASTSPTVGAARTRARRCAPPGRLLLGQEKRNGSMDAAAELAQRRRHSAPEHMLPPAGRRAALGRRSH